MNIQIALVSAVGVATSLSLRLISTHWREGLELVAFEPDRLTSENGMIRTRLLIHNPASRGNRIAALQLSVRDSSGQYGLEASLLDEALPLRSEKKIGIIGSKFDAHNLGRECILEVGLVDVFGKSYKFEQPFINVNSAVRCPEKLCKPAR